MKEKADARGKLALEEKLDDKVQTTNEEPESREVSHKMRAHQNPSKLKRLMAMS